MWRMTALTKLKSIKFTYFVCVLCIQLTSSEKNKTLFLYNNLLLVGKYTRLRGKGYGV